MPHKYQIDVKKRIDKIIESGTLNGSRKIDPLFEKYIKTFYRHAPLEYLQGNMGSLYASALEHWKFIKDRPLNAYRKVRVFNPTIELDGWKSTRTIVEINLQDSPFILDSVSSYLTSHGYNIYEVIHPVLSVERSSSGKITDININDDSNNDSIESSLESAMHFQISYIDEKKHLTRTQKEIENVLHFLKLAVNGWQDMQQKAHDIIASLSKNSAAYNEEKIKESKEFIKWITDDNFLFLGYQQYSFVDNEGNRKISVAPNSQLGIFCAKGNSSYISETKPLGIEALPQEVIEESIKNNLLVDITKSSRKSIVHRDAHMDYIGIKIFDNNGQVIGEHRLLGLFTSSVYYQNAMDIPIIRRKINSVLKRSGYAHNSHSGKALITVLQNYPRDELLQISENELFETGMGIVELAERPTTRLFARHDRFNRFVSCIIFLPKDRFNTNLREKVQKILEQEYNGIVTDYYTQVTESPLARVHMLVKIDCDNNISECDSSQIEALLVEVTTSWDKGLHNALIANVGEIQGEKLLLNYVKSFPESFKEHYHFGGIYKDVIQMEQAYSKDSLALDLYQLEKDADNVYNLKLFHVKSQVTLSDILPILENMGFHAIDELTFYIEPKNYNDGIWIHHFRLNVSRTIKIPHGLTSFKHKFEEALYKIWRGDIENDALNKLILRSGMPWRDVELLRAYSKYILQTDFTYSHDYMASAIARNPLITGAIVDLFHAMFTPNIAKKSRENKVNNLKEVIEKNLAKVNDVVEDKILQQFYATICATLRTNFYTNTCTNNQNNQDRKCNISNQDNQESYKKYISLKLDSTSVPNLPLPRPHVEIFVYSSDVEGIHLRGGKVARGGLRWSDRKEDFRTEVLGLVKAQMVKNSVIIPVGSKGGFVVKKPTEGSREQFIKQGQECYKTYLSGLLDITDNIIDDKIITPQNVICYDNQDPYLVVAADKGTATFSDIANQVAADYNFWLDDAFASGGSVGYDHKKMGITARGAWVSVKRHFSEMGIDCQKENFTAIGIGDMSGDVFGNGMLLSKHTRIIGAFNHMHIFIDPNPDAASSWKERNRLFALPRSSWMDYNQDLISKGGGIFNRSAKEIKINKTIKSLLEIEQDVITPDQLVQYLLKAEVDLLWNGGIGTYVKAVDESHGSVGDKANDILRINATQLRCKIIGEGGNLGFTQRSRIEYCANGGRINTDAIDNSAGVDCSDHEVNIKIALNSAVKSTKITQKKRNDILASMTDEVSDLVLQDNIMQTQSITIAQLEGHMILEQKARFINALEERGFLNRKIEFLPDNETLALRQNSGIGLYRPEISVLLAYGKMDIYQDILESNMPDDIYFESELLAYFPSLMRSKFTETIINHPLRREIIATIMANDLVNRMGCTFFQRMKEETGMKGCDIIRSYTVVRDACNLQQIWNEIDNLGTKISVETQSTLFMATRSLVERSVAWLLRHCTHPLKTTNLVDEYKPMLEKISLCFEDIISDSLKNTRNKTVANYKASNVPAALAIKIANLDNMVAAFDMAYVAKNSDMELTEIGKLYFAVGTRFNFGWLRYCANELLSHSHWENLAIRTFNETFYDYQMRITSKIIIRAKKLKDDLNTTEILEKWCSSNEKNISRYDEFISDLKCQETIEHSMLTIAVQRVGGLI